MSHLDYEGLQHYHEKITGLIDSVDASTRVVEISGATPTISALSNTLYVCGTLTSLTLTPPAEGITTVLFQSGSTATTLTLPSTVLMPSWFYIEPNKIYEISIAHGIYGSAMSWEVSS